jgi:hypothetical protein
MKIRVKLSALAVALLFAIGLVPFTSSPISIGSDLYVLYLQSRRNRNVRKIYTNHLKWYLS